MVNNSKMSENEQSLTVVLMLIVNDGFYFKTRFSELYHHISITHNTFKNIYLYFKRDILGLLVTIWPTWVNKVGM